MWIAAPISHLSVLVFRILIFLTLSLGVSQFLSAQRDTLWVVRFPYGKGYHQTFSGVRIRPMDTAFYPVKIHFYQEIAEDTINGNNRWFRFNTYSEVGPLPQKGYYYQAVSQKGEYKWYSGPEWNYLLIPAILYKGLWWESRQAGQKYRHSVVKTDTLITTEFGSHRCFVIKSEVRNAYFEGKKHRISTWDFYDSTLGKVKSATIVWQGRRGKQVFREEMELTDLGFGK